MRISFDLDGVLADMSPGIVHVANKIRPGWIAKDHQQQRWNFEEVFTEDEWQNVIWPECIKTPNFFLRLPAYGYVAAIPTFFEAYPSIQPWFVTARKQTAGAPILAQCVTFLRRAGFSERLVPEDGRNIVITPKRHKASWLRWHRIRMHIDDIASTVNTCNSENPHHDCYLLDQPWNAGADVKLRVPTVERYLEKALDKFIKCPR